MWPLIHKVLKDGACSICCCWRHHQASIGREMSTPRHIYLSCVGSHFLAQKWARDRYYGYGRPNRHPIDKWQWSRITFVKGVIVGVYCTSELSDQQERWVPCSKLRSTYCWNDPKKGSVSPILMLVMLSNSKHNFAIDFQLFCKFFHGLFTCTIHMMPIDEI